MFDDCVTFFRYNVLASYEAMLYRRNYIKVSFVLCDLNIFIFRKNCIYATSKKFALNDQNRFAVLHSFCPFFKLHFANISV